MKFGKFVEDERDAVLHPPIGILLDTVVVGLHVPDCDGQMKFTAPSFLAHGLDGPLTEDRQLHLAHCSLHAQQQPVVGRTRIVDSFFVHNQCTDQTAELQQCMPITTVPSQAGSFQ
jgi:hypothetical protein